MDTAAIGRTAAWGAYPIFQGWNFAQLPARDRSFSDSAVPAGGIDLDEP
jgi:hypothetical protein